MLCKPNVYCSFRLNANMHLLNSLAQKQIQYSSKKIKTAKSKLRLTLRKPAINKYANTKIIYVFNTILLISVFAANLQLSNSTILICRY